MRGSPWRVRDGDRVVRVLHVQETLSPRFGGPAEVVPRLAQAQQAAGHEVEVLTTNADYPDGVYQEKGWGTLKGGTVRVMYGAVQFRPLCVSLGLAAYLRRTIETFHIVHVHGLYRFPPTYAAATARRAGVPYVITPHGALDPYLYDKSSRSVWLKRLYERWLDLPNLHAAGAIHYTAEEERKRASFLKLRAPSFVVPVGIDWERYRALPPRGALRARWQLGEMPIVLFLGRVHFKKGLDLLIPAFDAVRRSVPKAHLVIAGAENDDYGQQVRQWIRERGLEPLVRFVGHLHREDVIQAYVDSDVFVLPSYTENFGMTVIESMACGLPVVISDQVNIHADVAASGGGLVTSCNVGDIAQALIGLLSATETRRQMGAAGRRVAQTYSWPAIVERLTEEYEAVIERTWQKYRENTA